MKTIGIEFREFVRPGTRANNYSTVVYGTREYAN